MTSSSDTSSGEAELREQVKVLGEKFLLRTADQITTLREHLVRLRGGDRDALTGIQELAHKIHGSGAMFGFAALSDRAGEIERLVVAEATSATSDRLSVLIDELAAALEATRKRN
jgi:chemotaxis protein histidine kinase CheA